LLAILTSQKKTHVATHGFLRHKAVFIAGVPVDVAETRCLTILMAAIVVDKEGSGRDMPKSAANR
jgi:hypothetical protein